MSKAGRIIKDATKFTLGGYLSSVFDFASAVIVRKVLDPFFMGLYTELLLVFDYAKYSHLGMIDALDRQIPYYNGKKEPDKRDEAVNAGASFSFFASLLCASIIAVAAYLLKGRISNLFICGLWLIALTVVIQSLSSLYVTLVRTNHLFGPLSIYVILVSVISVILKYALGINFGVAGILWSTVLALSISLFYLFRKTMLRFKISVKIPAHTLKELMKIGLPLFLTGFAFLFLRSVDRFMIIAFLRREDLGYYSIGIMMHSFVFQLPNLIYTVVFPRFYEAFGAFEDSVDNLRGYMEKPSLAFSYLFPVLIGLLLIMLPVFVNYMLPKYAEGITSASILLFGTIFLSITNMSTYLLVAFKKQNILLAISIIAGIANIIITLVFIKVFALGLAGVALGTAGAYLLYSFLLIGYSIGHYVDKGVDKVKFFIDLYAPSLYVIAALFLLKFFFRYNLTSIFSDIFIMLTQSVIFMILTLPLILRMNRKTRLFDTISGLGIDLIKEKFLKNNKESDL